MECSKTQRLFDDLSEDRLPETLSREVRRHLDECTDCRVAQQRAARLQQLLALKRHERPSPEYFDDFLREFHQRLQTETRTQAGWWEQLVASFTIERSRVWPYAFAGGMGVLLVVSVLMFERSCPDGAACRKRPRRKRPTIFQYQRLQQPHRPHRRRPLPQPCPAQLNPP